MKLDPLIVKLIRYRKLTGVSREYVARELGISQITVFRWEHGLAWPSSLGKIALAKFLRGRNI